MPGGEDEAVAVQPSRLIGVVLERVAVKHRADFRAAERQAEVAGLGRLDGVHGEAAGFVGGAGEYLDVQTHAACYNRGARAMKTISGEQRKRPCIRRKKNAVVMSFAYESAAFSSHRRAARGFSSETPGVDSEASAARADAPEGAVPAAAPAALRPHGFPQLPVQEVVATLFAAAQPGDLRDVLMEVFRWQKINVGGTWLARRAGCPRARTTLPLRKSSTNSHANRRTFSSISSMEQRTARARPGSGRAHQAALAGRTCRGRGKANWHIPDRRRAALLPLQKSEERRSGSRQGAVQARGRARREAGPERTRSASCRNPAGLRDYVRRPS